jgi:predicted  nucleic acid-binding Zn-ribbon protein
MVATGAVERAGFPLLVPFDPPSGIPNWSANPMAKNGKPIDLKQETADISTKIAGSYEKLAGKFRQKAQHAAEKVKDAKNEEKRALYRRRFELYGDAATDLEDRLRQLQGSGEKGSD